MAQQTYQTGLLGCTADTSSCIDTLFCYTCMMARQCNAVEGKIDECSCVPMIMTAMCPVVAACQIRSKVTNKYQLEDGCGCCMSIAFPGCSACQTHRELTLRGAWPGGSCLHKQPMQAIGNMA